MLSARAPGRRWKQVIRCFEDENVIHVAGKVDPQADMDVINLELALADLSQIEKRLERIQKLRAKARAASPHGPLGLGA